MPWSNMCSLSIPMAIKPADQKQSAQFKAGEAAFKSMGSAVVTCQSWVKSTESIATCSCTTWALSADADAYTVFAGDQLEAKDLAIAGRVRATRSPASFREWRTPPLWGMRDSAPYMHDGRAATISQAITLHAGEGATARGDTELSLRRKQQIETFLMSLAPPPATDR